MPQMNRMGNQWRFDERPMRKSGCWGRGRGGQGMGCNRQNRWNPPGNRMGSGQRRRGVFYVEHAANASSREG